MPQGYEAPRRSGGADTARGKLTIGNAADHPTGGAKGVTSWKVPKKLAAGHGPSKDKRSSKTRYRAGTGEELGGGGKALNRDVLPGGPAVFGAAGGDITEACGETRVSPGTVGPISTRKDATGPGIEAWGAGNPPNSEPVGQPVLPGHGWAIPIPFGGL